MNKTKRLLIVEECLRSIEGHWFAYLKTIKDAAVAMGWQVDVLCHEDATDDVANEFNHFPVFNRTVYLDKKEKKWPLERYYGFLFHNLAAKNKIMEHLKQHDRYDHIFVPTTLIQHLIAWKQIIDKKRIAPEKLTLFYVSHPGHWNETTGKTEVPLNIRNWILRWCLKAYSKHVENGSVVMGVEIAGAKEQFESLSGLPWNLLPHPVPEPPIYELSKRQGFKVFACYGFARYEKGSHIFAEAIEQILIENPDFEGHFRIQWINPYKGLDGRTYEPSQFLLNHPKVEVIDKGMNSDKYQEYLSSTDCMVLPYDINSYYSRVSRVAIEAINAGIELIYSQPGWLADFAEESGQTFGIKPEVKALKNAIVEVSKQERWKSTGGERWHSPEKFTELLLSSKKIEEGSP